MTLIARVYKHVFMMRYDDDGVMCDIEISRDFALWAQSISNHTIGSREGVSDYSHRNGNLTPRPEF